MSRLFRTLCVSLCAALVAVLSLHGVQEGRHVISHASSWPAAGIGVEGHAEVGEVDHGSLHVHVAPDAPADDPMDQVEDTDREGDAGRPASHHHHSGGDNHTAIPDSARGMIPVVATSAILLQPAADGARPGRTGDGPEYPPKRTRTVI